MLRYTQIPCSRFSCRDHVKLSGMFLTFNWFFPTLAAFNLKCFRLQGMQSLQMAQYHGLLTISSILLNMNFIHSTSLIVVCKKMHISCLYIQCIIQNKIFLICLCMIQKYLFLCLYIIIHYLYQFYSKLNAYIIFIKPGEELMNNRRPWQLDGFSLKDEQKHPQ